MLWSSYSLGNGTQDFKFPFLRTTTRHFWGLVCTSSHCQNTIHSHGRSTLCAHSCGISGVYHWSGYLIMKLHCKASIEKYLIWDETLLLTPGKVGMQPLAGRPEGIILPRAAGCTVYLYTPHHPFLKFPLYILWTCHCDACLCDLPNIVICRHLLCTPVTCAGIVVPAHHFCQWVCGGGVLLPLVYGPFKFQLHHFNPLFLLQISLFSLGGNFTFSSFPATKMMTNSDIIFCFCVFFVA